MYIFIRRSTSIRASVTGYMSLCRVIMALCRCVIMALCRCVIMALCDEVHSCACSREETYLHDILVILKRTVQNYGTKHVEMLPWYRWQ